MDLFTYLMAKKGHNTHRDLFSYLLGKKSQLPSEYQRLEYIESTGTQYIDTGVNADDINYSFNINFYGYETQSTQYPRVFGYQQAGGIFLGNKFWYGDNTNINSTEVLGIFNDEKHSVFANKDYAIVDNIKYLLNTPPTSLIKQFSNNIAIFGSFQGNSGAIKNDSPSKIKLYGFKIYHNNKLIRNFIPCMRNSDNEVGLYDTVGEQFYTNQGTGKFAYKGYTFIEYIQSTGTQYIDSNVNLTQNSSVELSISMNEKGTKNKMLFGSRAGASDNNISINVTETIVVDFNNSSYSTYRVFNSYEIDTKYILYNSKEKRIIYDENKNILAQNTTMCNDTITAPKTATLFYINPKPSNTWYIPNAKIYYCKIWNNGKLIRNFIPATRNSDNVAGLYDLVNDTFYENAGTGTFVTPTSQLSSTQSLNTSLLSNNLQEEPNLDEIEEQNEEPIENEEIEEPIEEYQEL